MANTKRDRALYGSSYFNQSHFSKDKYYLTDTILATTLAMFDYLEDAIFNTGKDADRIVYASNDYAFRARLENQKGNENSDFQLNTLNMPFVNFSLSSAGLGGTRLQSSYHTMSEGIYISETGKKIRVYPITLTFEGCFFTTQMADAHIVLQRLYTQSATQTIIKPILYYNSQPIEDYGEVTYDSIELDDKFKESEWLEQNRIHTVSFGISVNTYMLDVNPGAYDNSEEDTKYSIVNKVIFKLGTTKNIYDWNGWDEKTKKKHSYEVYTGILNHVTETINWSYNNVLE